jgi:membrane protease YdiL (CAAX protease family)
MPRIDHDRLRVFFGVLLALAAVFEVGLWITDADPDSSRLVYMFTPMIAGLAVVYRSEHSLGDFGVRVGNVRWLGGAVLVGLLIAGLTAVISMAVPGISVDVAGFESRPIPPGPLGVAVLVGPTVLMGVTVGAVTGFGEEFGWRGYLLWELAPLGFWKASFVIGGIWGLWHVPSIVQGLHQYPSFPYVGAVVFTAATIALSPVYTYLVWRSQSVFAAALLHGIFNASSFTVHGLLIGETALLEQLVATTIGVGGTVACVLLWGVIYFHGDPSLDRESLDWESSGSSISQTVTAD